MASDEFAVRSKDLGTHHQWCIGACCYLFLRPYLSTTSIDKGCPVLHMLTQWRAEGSFLQSWRQLVSAKPM